MKLTLLPSAVGDVATPVPQFLSTAILNDTIALDAGSLGLYASPIEQARIRHVLLTHSHIDHVASLPLFLENVYATHTEPVRVYGSTATLDCLRHNMFNGLIWPDFVALSRDNIPFVQLVPFESGETIELDGLNITAHTLDHVIPTLGFIIRDHRSSIAFVTDTGPTDAIWHAANALPDLKAVFLEATFPNEKSWLADLSKHHTAASFALEIRKLARQVRIVAMHIKARYREEVAKQLMEIAGVELAVFGVPYEF